MATLLVLAIITVLLIFQYILNRKPEVTNYRITSKLIPNSLEELKIAVIADLHNHSYGKGNKRLLKVIRENPPDLIIVAGDMVVRKKPNEFKTAKNLLISLAAKFPIYYGLGNHEQSLIVGNKVTENGFEDYKNELRNAGIEFLDNTSVKVERQNDSIILTGLSIGKEYYQKGNSIPMPKEYIQNLVGISNKKCYNILIAHNPMYFDAYEDWGADLVISGHVHGGVIRLPYFGGMLSPQYKFFPKYDAGSFVKNKTTMLISRGLGAHTLKFRIFNQPELMIITLARRS